MLLLLLLLLPQPNLFLLLMLKKLLLLEFLGLLNVPFALLQFSFPLALKGLLLLLVVQ